jgi:8-oxo-dGTP diphosphatase
MIEYYGNLAASYGGRLTAKYKNAICLVLSEDKIFSRMDSSLEIEPFFLVSVPHPKIVPGFPLDALSVQIESGKYFQDLKHNLAVDKNAVENGFAKFFKENLEL